MQSRRSLPHMGEVVIFSTAKQPPPGILRRSCRNTELVCGYGKDNHLISIYERYFSELYWKANSWMRML